MAAVHSVSLKFKHESDSVWPERQASKRDEGQYTVQAYRPKFRLRGKRTVMLLRGQSVILLLAIRADRKRLVILCGHEENATDSPNGCALDGAPSEMRTVRIVAVPAWLGLGDLSPGDKGFELGDTFGPPARLSNVRVGVLVAIPALLRRTQGDESADCELPR